MKRRRFFRAMAAAPLAPSLIAQQTAAPSNAPGTTSPAPPALDATQPPASLNRAPTAMTAPVKIGTAVADEVAEMALRYFTSAHFSALRKLSETIMPPMNGAPGALEAGAPEFLDFLIRESPQDRQQLYKVGLDRLNAQAKKRFNKTFADLDATQTATMLAPPDARYFPSWGEELQNDLDSARGAGFGPTLMGEVCLALRIACASTRTWSTHGVFRC